ncbi:universal stress protein [Kutzneria chonburiensis]|uniref:Universal stress protein n=1 Tax=Kutzneria chonburiensis TaxID=1483604 RepID=A0ABV6MWA0_9PSEU|nr:universal stress protein [Kutzneria chonburiensis]
MPEDAAVPGFEIGKDGVGSIVVGVDGSPPAVHAAAWAAGLARRERARLVLVYVEPLASAAYWTSIGMINAAEAANDFVAELRTEAGQYLTQYGIEWDLLHHRGDPATALEQIAEELRADCIVVGRSQRGGHLLGSVPKTLVTRAQRPVVVVP